MKRVKLVVSVLCLAWSGSSFARGMDVSFPGAMRETREDLSSTVRMEGNLSCAAAVCGITVAGDEGTKYFQLTDDGSSAKLYRAGARKVAVAGTLATPSMVSVSSITAM
jgi:hypothetical protein